MILDYCLSFLKCCGTSRVCDSMGYGSHHPLIEVDDLECCINCCRDKRNILEHLKLERGHI